MATSVVMRQQAITLGMEEYDLKIAILSIPKQSDRESLYTCYKWVTYRNVISLINQDRICNKKLNPL